MRRRHTTGSFLHSFPPIVYLASRVHAGDVTWLSPAAGEVYKWGDTIVGQWTANDSFSSPSFSLCTSGYGGGDEPSVECGSAVWPIVEENGSTEIVHLGLPAGAIIASFHLQMSDATSEKSVISPQFSLKSTSVAPVSSTHSPVEVPATTAAAAVPNQISASSSSHLASDYNSLRSPTPTAAYAVPLSLVGIILLVAGALWMYYQRKLRKEQAQKLSRPRYQRASSSYTRFPERHARAGVVRRIGSRPTASMAGSYHEPEYFKGDHVPTEVGSRSLKRQPLVRRTTREPFPHDVHLPHVTYNRRRPAKISAGAFRAGASPFPSRLPQLSFLRPGVGTLRGEAVPPGLARKSTDDSFGAVVDRSFHLTSPPEGLHTRRDTKDYSGLSYKQSLPRCPAQLSDGSVRRVSWRDLVLRESVVPSFTGFRSACMLL